MDRYTCVECKEVGKAIEFKPHPDRPKCSKCQNYVFQHRTADNLHEHVCILDFSQRICLACVGPVVPKEKEEPKEPVVAVPEETDTPVVWIKENVKVTETKDYQVVIDAAFWKWLKEKGELKHGKYCIRAKKNFASTCMSRSSLELKRKKFWLSDKDCSIEKQQLPKLAKILKALKKVYLKLDYEGPLDFVI